MKVYVSTIKMKLNSLKLDRKQLIFIFILTISFNVDAQPSISNNSVESLSSSDSSTSNYVSFYASQNITTTTTTGIISVTQIKSSKSPVENNATSNLLTSTLLNSVNNTELNEQNSSSLLSNSTLSNSSTISNRVITRFSTQNHTIIVQPVRTSTSVINVTEINISSTHVNIRNSFGTELLSINSTAGDFLNRNDSSNTTSSTPLQESNTTISSNLSLNTIQADKTITHRSRTFFSSNPTIAFRSSTLRHETTGIYSRISRTSNLSRRAFQLSTKRNSARTPTSTQSQILPATIKLSTDSLSINQSNGTVLYDGAVTQESIPIDSTPSSKSLASMQSGENNIRSSIPFTYESTISVSEPESTTQKVVPIKSTSFASSLSSSSVKMESKFNTLSYVTRPGNLARTSVPEIANVTQQSVPNASQLNNLSTNTIRSTSEIIQSITTGTILSTDKQLRTSNSSQTLVPSDLLQSTISLVTTQSISGTNRSFTLNGNPSNIGLSQTSSTTPTVAAVGTLPSTLLSNTRLPITDGALFSISASGPSNATLQQSSNISQEVVPILSLQPTITSASISPAAHTIPLDASPSNSSNQFLPQASNVSSEVVSIDSLTPQFSSTTIHSAPNTTLQIQQSSVLRKRTLAQFLSTSHDTVLIDTLPPTLSSVTKAATLDKVPPSTLSMNLTNVSVAQPSNTSQETVPIHSSHSTSSASTNVPMNNDAATSVSSINPSNASLSQFLSISKEAMPIHSLPSTLSSVTMTSKTNSISIDPPLTNLSNINLLQLLNSSQEPLPTDSLPSSLSSASQQPIFGTVPSIIAVTNPPTVSMSEPLKTSQKAISTGTLLPPLSSANIADKTDSVLPITLPLTLSNTSSSQPSITLQEVTSNFSLQSTLLPATTVSVANNTRSTALFTSPSNTSLSQPSNASLETIPADSSSSTLLSATIVPITNSVTAISPPTNLSNTLLPISNTRQDDSTIDLVSARLSSSTAQAILINTTSSRSSSATMERMIETVSPNVPSVDLSRDSLSQLSSSPQTVLSNDSLMVALSSTTVRLLSDIDSTITSSTNFSSLSESEVFSSAEGSASQGTILARLSSTKTQSMPRSSTSIRPLRSASYESVAAVSYNTQVDTSVDSLSTRASTFASPLGINTVRTIIESSMMPSTRVSATLNASETVSDGIASSVTTVSTLLIDPALVTVKSKQESSVTGNQIISSVTTATQMNTLSSSVVIGRTDSLTNKNMDIVLSTSSSVDINESFRTFTTGIREDSLDVSTSTQSSVYILQQTSSIALSTPTVSLSSTENVATFTDGAFSHVSQVSDVAKTPRTTAEPTSNILERLTTSFVSPKQSFSLSHSNIKTTTLSSSVPITTSFFTILSSLNTFRSKHSSITNTNKHELSSPTTIVNDEAKSSGTSQYMAPSTETPQQTTGTLQITESSLTSPNIILLSSPHPASTSIPSDDGAIKTYATTIEQTVNTLSPRSILSVVPNQYSASEVPLQTTAISPVEDTKVTRPSLISTLFRRLPLVETHSTEIINTKNDMGTDQSSTPMVHITATTSLPTLSLLTRLIISSSSSSSSRSTPVSDTDVYTSNRNSMGSIATKLVRVTTEASSSAKESTFLNRYSTIPRTLKLLPLLRTLISHSPVTTPSVNVDSGGTRVPLVSPSSIIKSIPTSMTKPTIVNQFSSKHSAVGSSSITPPLSLALTTNSGIHKPTSTSTTNTNKRKLVSFSQQVSESSTNIVTMRDSLSLGTTETMISSIRLSSVTPPRSKSTLTDAITSTSAETVANADTINSFTSISFGTQTTTKNTISTSRFDTMKTSVMPIISSRTIDISSTVPNFLGTDSSSQLLSTSTRTEHGATLLSSLLRTSSLLASNQPSTLSKPISSISLTTQINSNATTTTCK